MNTHPIGTHAALHAVTSDLVSSNKKLEHAIQCMLDVNPELAEISDDDMAAASVDPTADDRTRAQAKAILMAREALRG